MYPVDCGRVDIRIGTQHIGNAVAHLYFCRDDRIKSEMLYTESEIVVKRFLLERHKRPVGCTHGGLVALKIEGKLSATDQVKTGIAVSHRMVFEQQTLIEGHGLGLCNLRRFDGIVIGKQEVALAELDLGHVHHRHVFVDPAIGDTSETKTGKTLGAYTLDGIHAVEFGGIQNHLGLAVIGNDGKPEVKALMIVQGIMFNALCP